jgi:O-antigen ligase
MIFYTERHKNRFYLFLSIIGFLSSIIAITFYLNNNPDIFIIKNSYYKNASTGFFINRTVFAVFLLFSLISSLELLKNLNVSAKKKDNFFLKIYIRLFVIFISIAIITSFSRIGNFLLLFTIFFYFINENLIKKNKNKSFKIILLIIIIFDILIMGIYFGSFQIMDRFYFLKEEFSEIYDSNLNLSRFDIARFGLNQIKNFLFFGYGSGAFEFLFQTNFINLKNSFANHAHSDLVEFVGEFGLLGITLLFFSLLRFFLNKRFFNFLNSIFFFYLLIILLFDFSLHIPIIQILFITFFILNFKKTN